MSVYMKFETEREALIAALVFIDSLRNTPQADWRASTQAFVIGESIRRSLPHLIEPKP